MRAFKSPTLSWLRENSAHPAAETASTSTRKMNTCFVIGLYRTIVGDSRNSRYRSGSMVRSKQTRPAL